MLVEQSLLATEFVKIYDVVVKWFLCRRIAGHKNGQSGCIPAKANSPQIWTQMARWLRVLEVGFSSEYVSQFGAL